MSDGLAGLLDRELAAAGRSSWSTSPVVASAATPGRAVVDGRERLLLCTNDYLGLAGDPRVTGAAAAAIERYGFGSRAARSLGGDTDAHRELEQELAAFKGVEAALTFSSGFACNVAVIGALMREGDVILSDALNHASIVDGCRLSPARTVVYRHGAADDLAARLAEAPAGGKRMVVTDAVFSMDGDVAPLPALVAAADRHGAFVMLDEAHATGVLGPRGKGTLAHFGLEGRVPVLMGTLGKALGSSGGYIAGSRALIDYLARSARSFLFTTAPPAAAAAAALAALRALRAEPERVERLWENARALHAGVTGLGFATVADPAPIVAVLFSDQDAAVRASRVLFEHGVVSQAIGPPYVAAGTSRLRMIVSAAHDADDIARVVAAFAAVASS